MIRLLKSASALAKCFFVLSLSAYAFYCQDWRVLAALIVLLLGLLALSGDMDKMVGLMFAVFAASLPTLLLIFLLGGIEKADDWRSGVLLGLDWLAVFSLRLLLLVLADILVVKWTTFSDLLLSLRALRLPGKLVLFFSTLATMVPNVFGLAMHVVEVQRCRGFEPKKLLNPKNFLPLFVPVFLAQMKRSTDLALSLELRGISGRTLSGGGRLSFGPGDVLLVAAALAIWCAGRGWQGLPG
jgi:energy-coupling factor transport system permease protein